MKRNETLGPKASAGCKGQEGAPASAEAGVRTHILASCLDWLYFIQHCSRHDTSMSASGQ